MGWNGTDPGTTVAPTGYGSRGAAATTTLRRPANWNLTDEKPLYVCLHTNGSTGGAFLIGQGLDRAHNFDDGCYVLAPNGVPIGGGAAGWDYFTTPTAFDDFHFILDCIAWVTARYPISYIVFVGGSNGGFMAIQMAQVFPTLMHSLCLVGCAGGVNDSVAVAPVPIPTLLVYGDADTVVVPGGEDPAAHLPAGINGHGGIGSTGFVSAVATVGQAASRNGLGGSLGAAGAAFDYVSPIGTLEATAQLYSGTTTQNHVELWKCAAIGHAGMFNVSANRRGSSPFFTWSRVNHRTP